MNQYIRNTFYACGLGISFGLTGCGVDASEDYVVPIEQLVQSENLLSKKNRYCFVDDDGKCRSQTFLDTYGIEKAVDDDESSRFIPQFPWDENTHTTNSALSAIWGGNDPYYTNRMLRVQLTELTNEYREISRIVIRGDIIEARPSQNTVIRPLNANPTQIEIDNRTAFEQGEWAKHKQFPIHALFVAPRTGYTYNTSVFFVEKGTTSPTMKQYDNTYPMTCEKLEYKPSELIDCTLTTPIKAFLMTLEIKQTRTNVNKGISEIKLYGP